jgi:uncharacterized membrane protein
MELVISRVLRGGVLLSAAVVLAGALGYAMSRDAGYASALPGHPAHLLAYPPPKGAGAFPETLPAVVAGVLSGKPYAIIALGLLLLIATPVVRVGLSVLFFLAERDWLYVGITLFVLAILLLGLVIGIG